MLLKSEVNTNVRTHPSPASLQPGTKKIKKDIYHMPGKDQDDSIHAAHSKNLDIGSVIFGLPSQTTRKKIRKKIDQRERNVLIFRLHFPKHSRSGSISMFIVTLSLQ